MPGVGARAIRILANAFQIFLRQTNDKQGRGKHSWNIVPSLHSPKPVEDASSRGWVLTLAIRDEFVTRGHKGLNKRVNFHFLKLTLYSLNSSFRCFSGHSLRQALFVYQLIVATLIGNRILQSKFWQYVTNSSHQGIKGYSVVVNWLSGSIL